MAGRHLRTQLREIPLLVLAWLLAWPLGLLFPRRRDLVVVIGRDDGRFSDNAKYFYISGRAGAAGRDLWFLTGDDATAGSLQAHGAAVAYYPSWRGICLLLRAGIVVADSAEWVRAARYQLACRAHKVQLWHGVPLKMIELMVLQRRLGRMKPPLRLLYRLYTRLYARYPVYDAVLSTSPAVTAAAFRDSFRARRIIECGYPRNDVLDAGTRDALGPLVWINTDGAALQRVRRLAGQDSRVVLYAPTFRTHGRNPVGNEVLDYGALDEFARRQNLVIAVKLHPVLEAGAGLRGLERVIEYDARTDVYPLLGETDLLVTDYSSIYFDFLLQDRPIVFFTYDHAGYQARERDLVFRFEDMAPGPRADTQAQLEQEITTALCGRPDPWAARRAAVRNLVFGQHVGAGGPVIWNMLDRLRDGGP